MGVEDNCRLYLRGNGKSKIAYVDVGIFGNESHRGYDSFTAAISKIFAEVLAVPPDNVYVNYHDIIGWGAGGIYFDRYQY